ncbi:hypothetical protein PC118_g637 [Phytophthora cactorum]|uniref:DDE Tnp4 domain-containing protein n=1 Tax=Phytophthora cactorum TaxID=29920 RepID=A0A8T1GV00_9STRA|nr:hypothetical protein PC118_g637 [Phytophthora cactorum]
MAQADEDKDAEALVLFEVVCAAAIAATTARLLCGRDHSFEKKMGLLLLYLYNVFIISKPHAAGWREIMDGVGMYAAFRMSIVLWMTRFSRLRDILRSYSDKKTWKVSKMGTTIQNVILPGCHFLGDAGFTLSCELQTPYIPREEGGKLSCLQERYNYIHSATRMAIECAFGMLKQRFRLIRRQLEQMSIANCMRNEQDAPNVTVLEIEPGVDRCAICRVKRVNLASLFNL